MTERVCGTCAWWQRNRFQPEGGDPAAGNWPCEWDNQGIPKLSHESCRHHATTRSWGEDEVDSIYKHGCRHRLTLQDNHINELAAEVARLKARCREAREFLERGDRFIYEPCDSELETKIAAWLGVSDDE